MNPSRSLLARTRPTLVGGACDLRVLAGHTSRRHRKSALRVQRALRAQRAASGEGRQAGELRRLRV